MTAIKFPILFLIAFLVGSDEFLLGPILAPIGNDLGVPPERVTLFIAAYALPLALLAPAAGFLSDRYGRLSVLLPATAIVAVASILTGFAASFGWALAMRVLTGVGSAGMLPIAFAMAADEGDQSARGISFVMGGLTTGIMISPGLGAFVSDLWSWRAAFILLGAAALVTVLPALVLWRSNKPVAHGEVPASRSRVLVPGAVGALCGMFFGIGGAVGVYSLVGERLRDVLILDTQQIGLVYVGFGVLSVAGNALAPGAIRRIGGARQTMRLAIGAVVLCVVAVFALPNPSLPSIGLALAVWALLGGIGAPALQAHIARLSAARRGTLMALGSSALNLGVALAATLAGEAYLHGSGWVALLGAVLLTIAVVALARPREPGPAPSG
ncbi:MAG: MFS transporter [Mesorhizobium sp.]|nr:MFS transporter [Mesorhizobium sp.]